jgi:tetratricopeptide (TPR) repeat protein
MTGIRSLLVLLIFPWVVAAASAGEEALVPGIYDQEDPAAVAWHPPPGQKAKFRELLNKELQRHPRNVVARVHRAYLLDRAGSHERAQRDYEAALEAAAPRGLEHRHILWSRGWSRYDSEDLAGALEDWRECVREHGGRPHWVAYTFALAYWTNDDRSQALAWYAAAVASNGEWGTEAGMAERTRHWRPKQRERMQALFRQWHEQMQNRNAARPDSAFP